MAEPDPAAAVGTIHRSRDRLPGIAPSGHPPGIGLSA